MDDKAFKLIEKMYIEMQKGFKEVNERLDQKADKTDIVRLGQEYGTKLEALFDFQKTQEEVNERVLSALDRIEEKLETHDIQIRVLDKTKANAK